MNYSTIREYLEKTGKSERQFARMLGISQSHLNMIKNGSRRPSPELARKIEKITGIPFRSLLVAEDDREYRVEHAEPERTDCKEKIL
jgi:transcriptional regulator with XRE-family HTH domain